MEWPARAVDGVLSPTRKRRLGVAPSLLIAHILVSPGERNSWCVWDPSIRRFDMKRNDWALFFLAFTVCFLILSCSKRHAQHTELKTYSISSMSGVISQSGVVVDLKDSSDGDGSLKITADSPRTVRLYETGDLDVEDARLAYRAKLRTENVEGKVYLEMWCHFPGKGEYFSRAMNTPLTGTVGWTSQETPFFLKKGENPDNVRLNLVIDGKGTVWIDDIHLISGPM
jgi:hypothetical protein